MFKLDVLIHCLCLHIQTACCQWGEIPETQLTSRMWFGCLYRQVLQTVSIKSASISCNMFNLSYVISCTESQTDWKLSRLVSHQQCEAQTHNSRHAPSLCVCAYILYIICVCAHIQQHKDLLIYWKLFWLGQSKNTFSGFYWATEQKKSCLLLYI